MNGGRPYARITFSKQGSLRFVGHLDMARAFDRAIRRSGIAVAYSEGFNPRAKVSFGPPLPLGAEGEGELCIVELADPVPASELAERLGAELPDGIGVIGIEIGERGRRSPMADLSSAVYEIHLRLDGVDGEQVAQAVCALREAESIPVRRITKRRDEVVDVRPGIVSLQFEAGPPARLMTELRMGEESPPRPRELVTALNIELSPAGSVSVARLIRKSLR